jgi:hypothetical protein
MKKGSFLDLLLLVTLLSATPTFAANTANILGGGVCINEVLIDPNGENNFDTDNNGTAEDSDEFIEFYNLSTTDIDISGWQLWDASDDNWFTFPGSADDGTTVLKSAAYAVIVVGIQEGGSLPIMTNPESIAFDAARDSLFNNLGDNVVLYNPGADTYIQLLFNADAADNPPIDYAGSGFSATAVRVGSIEDFGSDTDGKSLTRYPAGDTEVVIHDAIPGVTAFASPTKVALLAIRSHRVTPALGPAVIVFLIISLCARLYKVRRTL